MVDKPADTLFTSNERESLESLARQRGFVSARQYLLALAAVDAAQHGDTIDITPDDALGDPAESFRQAWAQAMQGDLLTEDDFWQAVADDE